MKKLSNVMFGALALVGVSTSMVFASEASNVIREGAEDMIHTEIVINEGDPNNFLHSNGYTILGYDTDDGIDYKFSEGDLEKILSKIKNGTYDMSKPFVIFETDFSKDLYMLVWNGSELTESRMSDSLGNDVIEYILNDDGTITEKIGVLGLDDNGNFIVIENK